MEHLYLWLAISGISTVLAYTVFRQRRHEGVFAKRLQVHHVLEEILNNTHAIQVLLVRTKNGMGAPSIDSKIKIDVLFEEYRTPATNVKGLLQDVEVDKFYSKFLRAAVMEGHTTVLIDNMEPINTFKIFLEQSNAIQATIYFIKITTKHHYFLVTTTDEYNQSRYSTVDNTVITNLYINKLKKFF